MRYRSNHGGETLTKLQTYRQRVVQRWDEQELLFLGRSQRLGAEARADSRHMLR